MRNNEQQNAKNTSAKRGMRVAAGVALVVCAIVLVMGSLLAKYIASSSLNAETESSAFHISSDYLKDSSNTDSTGSTGSTGGNTGATNSGSGGSAGGGFNGGSSAASYSVADWKDGFDIKLYNYEKENIAQVSQVDITYEVKASNVTVSVRDQAGNAVSEANGKYLLPAKSTSANTSGNTSEGTSGGTSEGTSEATFEKCYQTLHVTPSSSAGPSNPITVTVQTTAPYKKTLSATFAPANNTQPDYTIKDQGNGTVLLTVRTNDYNGKMTVKWDSGKFSPDNTNNLMSSWTDANQSGTFMVKSKSTYELLFFKNKNDSFDKKTGIGTEITLE